MARLTIYRGTHQIGGGHYGLFKKAPKGVSMYTEKADEFTSIPAFAPYEKQVQVLTDGMSMDLDELCANT